MDYSTMSLAELIAEKKRLGLEIANTTRAVRSRRDFLKSTGLNRKKQDQDGFTVLAGERPGFYYGRADKVSSDRYEAERQAKIRFRSRTFPEKRKGRFGVYNQNEKAYNNLKCLY